MSLPLYIGSRRETITRLTAGLLVFLFLISPLAYVRAEELMPDTNSSSEQPTEEMAQPVEENSEPTVAAPAEEEATPTEEENTDEPQQLLVDEPKSQPDKTPKQKVAQPDEASGALIYQYPIAVSAGRNNMQPSLELTYNSQASDKESIAGQGWSLSIPYIERINRKGVDKLYTENYFNSYLDGELINVSGNEYGAKVTNGEFIKYTFSNNIWAATDKQGNSYTFGLNSASRQDDSNNTQHVYKWMLTEIRDANNNFVRYEYVKNNNQIYPSKIFYTGSGSADGIFEIEFIYESRLDATTSYKTGFTITTNSRLKEIINKVNGQWTRKYTIVYITGDNSKTSLINTITESGRSELGELDSLEPVRFEYQKTNPNQSHWTEDTTTYTAPITVNYYHGSMLADVNGDGYEDILKSLENTYGVQTKKVYLSDGQGNWTLSANYIPPIIFVNTDFYGSYEKGVRLIDLNADGLLDIVQRTPSRESAWINTGNGWQQNNLWIPPWPMDLARTPDYNVPAYLADINGDGLPDLIRAEEISPNQIDTRVFLNNGNGWTEDFDWASPIQVNSAYGEMFVDVNGDGLADIIQSYESGSEIVKKVFLNNGQKTWIENIAYQVPVIFVQRSQSGPQDQGVRLVDVNGDGLLDILRGNWWSPNDDAYINTGNGWQQDTKWNPPIEFLSNDPADDSNIRGNISSVTGDSLADIFQAKGNGYGGVITINYANNEKKVNFLKKITYPTGGTTDIEYQATPLYKNGSALLNPNLHQAIETVKQITNTPGFEQLPTSTTYSYEGGEYYYNNAHDYKFAGFAKVTKTDELSKTINFYHQGNTSNSGQGEYQDHISKIGKLYRQEIRDLNGNLFSKTISKWDRHNLANGRDFVKLVQTVESIYDGNSSHKDRATTFAYNNQTGDKTNENSYGEVSALDDGTFTDVGTDKYATEINYASNASGSRLPSIVTTNDFSNTKIKESRYYYDNLPLGQVSLGNETKREEWRSGTQYINTQKSYNSYGLTISSADANGKTTSYAYDSYNLYPITITNPLQQATSFSYDYSSGQVNQTIDPNGRVFYTDYDGLDRVSAERQPDPANPNLSVAKTTYEYIDSVNNIRVQKMQYLDASNRIDNFTYFDGLGRKIQERTESENSSQFMVRDFVYTTNDLLDKESLPYFSTGSARTPRTETASLYTDYSYDTLNRVLSALTAVGATTNTYDDWKTTITDTKGKVKDIFKDAYDNLVQVAEHNGSSIYNTYYTWNGLKKLTNITDALGNVRNFSYDGLGRVLSAEDLHALMAWAFGTWYYGYDNNGNIISRIDPKNQTVTYQYDDASRVISEDSDSTVDIDVTYAYDACSDGVGRLCTVTSRALTDNRSYNALGQMVSQTKRIGKTNYTSEYQYDRQGNQTIITNPDGSQVAYTYNAAGSIERVERKEAQDPTFTDVISSIDYNEVGLPTVTTYGNGSVNTNTYDAAELYRLRHKVTVANSQNVQDLTYTYDSVGNITRIVDASATQTAKTTDYTYDDLHRLLSATITDSAAQGIDGPEDANQIQTFTYDAIGNILTKSDVGDYMYGGGGLQPANPHAVTQAGNNTYAYDANGNMVVVGNIMLPQTTTYAWDYNNRLVSVDKNSAISSYAYDVDGQRVKATDASGTTIYATKEYTITPQGIEKHIFLGDTAVATVTSAEDSATVYSIHTDHLTGSNVITDESQNIDELTDYYSFGTMRIDQQNGEHREARKFTNHEHDYGTGLTYANARYYEPTLGRWLSQDQVFLSVFDPQKIEEKTEMQYAEYLSNPQYLNSYSYVANNPLKYKDQTGDFLFLAVPLIVYAPIWIPAVITATAAVTATVASINLTKAIQQTSKGDYKAADKSLNNVETSLGVAAVVTTGGLAASEVAATRAASNAKVADSISKGHAYDKHVVQRGEFNGMVNNRTEFKQHIESVINKPSNVRSLENGRTAYLQKSTNTIVIKNPQARDYGTAYRPSSVYHNYKSTYDYFKKGLK